MRKNTSNIVKGFCAILLLGITAVSCRQDPIFYIITTETAPIPPRIPGSPTNMVVFERNYLSDPADPGSEKTIPLLFVASGSLHWYGGDPFNPGWDGDYGIPQPAGRVISLAVTENRLYALCLHGNSLIATLQYIGRTGGWNTISGIGEYPSIQSIYSTYSGQPGEQGQLFAGASISSKTSITYAILYLENDTLKVLKRETSMLSGAVYRNSNDTYYLCTRGDGIFHVGKTNLAANTVSQLKNINFVSREEPILLYPGNPDDPDDPPVYGTVIVTEPVEDVSNILFMGMIKLKDSAESIIAIERTTRRGTLYEVLESEELAAYFSPIIYSNNSVATIGTFAIGALALWQDRDEYVKKLVVGRQGTLSSTSYNNGYVEFYLRSDNSFDKDNATRFMDTVHGNTDRYSTNLGKHPINHLFQVPREVDDNMTFFASTQAAGLWSYRNRPGNGGWQWNAEN